MGEQLAVSGCPNVVADPGNGKRNPNNTAPTGDDAKETAERSNAEMAFLFNTTTKTMQVQQKHRTANIAIVEGEHEHGLNAEPVTVKINVSYIQHITSMYVGLTYSKFINKIG